MLNILWWCLFGLLVGAVARLLVPGRDPMGCLGTILVGVAGAFVGGLLASLLFGWPRETFATHSFLGAVIGGIIVVLLVRQFRRPRRI